MVVDTAASDADLGTYTGLYYIASQLAAVVGPIVNGYIVEWEGWRLQPDLCRHAGLFRAGDPVYAGRDTGRGKTSRCDLANTDDPQYAPLELQQPAIDQDKPLSPLTKSSPPPGFSSCGCSGFRTACRTGRCPGLGCRFTAASTVTTSSGRLLTSETIPSPLPSSFSPLPGTESFALFTTDYRTDRFFGQHGACTAVNRAPLDVVCDAGPLIHLDELPGPVDRLPACSRAGAGLA